MRGLRSTLRLQLCLSSVLITAACIVACGEDGASRRNPIKRGLNDPSGVGGDFNDPHNTAKEGLPDPLEGMVTGTNQNSALCARAGVKAGTTLKENEANPSFNAVTNAFCRERAPITNIVELRDAIGLEFQDDNGRTGTNGSNGNPGFAFLGHSSSLVARSVSAINPRVLIFSPPPGQPTRIPGFVVMGFARGEPFVEIAAEQAKGGKLSFYLAKISLACEETHSCTPSDLLTPAIERNWKDVTIYDDEDLKNTIVDCRHCHQPEGPSQKMMLRMQEMEDPWTHWFRSDRPGGIALMQDFFRAHGDNEDYGGVPAGLINKSDGRALEDLVKGQGFEDQPSIFDSKKIEREIASSAKDQPLINTPKGSSATWSSLHSRALAGDFIPVPYHDVKVTDPDKLQFATDEYKKFVAGGAGSSKSLPDIRRVFLDDALEDLAFIPKAGASGKEVLVQACAQCHNARLDPAISRARFDVTKLDSMSKDAKKAAIDRLKLPPSDRLHMPPAMMRTMPQDSIDAAIAELSK